MFYTDTFTDTVLPQYSGEFLSINCLFLEDLQHSGERIFSDCFESITEIILMFRIACLELVLHCGHRLEEDQSLDMMVLVLKSVNDARDF